MKAIVQSKYGSADDLELKDIDRPVVKDDEVLVRVRAASVHPDVWHVLKGRPYVLRIMGSGLRKPKSVVPGTDVAGQVESVGGNVTRFQAGDEVFGESIRGYQWRNGGAYAEYVSVPEEVLALKPANLTYEQAAAVPTAGLIALQGIRHQGDVQPGQKVLVNGAGGGVGIFAVQLAKSYGAEVTGVDSTSKLEILRSIGADHVVDYTKQDFTQGDEHYDVILDIPGNHSFSSIKRALNPDGTYVLIGHDHFGAAGHSVLGSLPRFLKMVVMSPFVRQLPKTNFSMPDKKDSMVILKELLETGELRPIVDRTFPLSEVPDAIRHMEAGHSRGKIIVTV